MNRWFVNLIAHNFCFTEPQWWQGVYSSPRVYPFNKDADFKTLEGGEIIALVFQISPEMVFWVGFWGPNLEA